VPYWWRSRASLSLLIKTAVDPSSIVPAVGRAVHAIDPDIALGDSQPLERVVEGSLAGRRYQMEMFVAFGAVALLIALVGVYAVTAYGVARRRREMNIRAALGAERSQVLSLIVRETSLPIAAGVLVGTAGALAIGDATAGLLFGVAPRNPLVISIVAAVVGGAAILSCFWAASQGLATNPAAALRDD
jgi:putative ABC transport system permease protein